jgi:hypothetical protein
MPPKKEKPKEKEKRKPASELTSDELAERIFSKKGLQKLKQILQEQEKKGSKKSS